MADVLFLPTTKEGYNALLVVVDLGSHLFDIEPIKDKTSETLLEALKKIYERGILKKPEYSMATDDGSEWLKVFGQWLYDNSIFHKVARANRHTQQAPAENKNKQLGRLFNGYMNAMEEKTGEQFNEWTNVVDIVRKKLNKVTKREEKDWMKKEPKKDPDDIEPKYAEPKYKIGQTMYYKSEHPLNALGQKQPTNRFREADYRFNRIEPRKITRILDYPPPIYHRYLLKDVKNVSFTENELKPAPTQDNKYVVREILEKKMINKKPHYLIWWKGYKKSESTYEPEKNLIEDGFKDMIDDFNSR
jgi:hypothetical protein